MNYSAVFENYGRPKGMKNQYAKVSHCSWLPEAAFQSTIP